MILARLQRLAEDFTAVAPVESEELASACRDLAINQLDVRHMVLGECLTLTWHFWGEGEGQGVGPNTYGELARIWAAYLPGILKADSEDEGVALTLALLEERRVVGTGDRLS